MVSVHYHAIASGTRGNVLLKLGNIVSEVQTRLLFFDLHKLYIPDVNIFYRFTVSYAFCAMVSVIFSWSRYNG